MLKHKSFQLRLLTVALIVAVVGFAGLLAFTSETSGEGGLVSPVPPLPGSPPTAILVDSGTIGSGECFVSIQKVFQGPLQVDRPVIEGETGRDCSAEDGRAHERTAQPERTRSTPGPVQPALQFPRQPVDDGRRMPGPAPAQEPIADIGCEPQRGKKKNQMFRPRGHPAHPAHPITAPTRYSLPAPSPAGWRINRQRRGSGCEAGSRPKTRQPIAAAL